MEIIFTQVAENKWESEFTASADFNLHIEKEESGILLLQQRGSDSGKYDTVGGLKISPSDLVLDCDFAALVYPKYIKVISEVQPTLGVVTFNA